MTERIRPRRHDDATFVPGSQHNIFTDSENSEATVMVSHGPYMERLPVGNMTVGEIRMRFGDRLDIDPQSQAVVDGQEVNESTRLTVGQVLTFVRKAGEKGTSASAINLVLCPINRLQNYCHSCEGRSPV